jgi:hypothetical protein
MTQTQMTAYLANTIGISKRQAKSVVGHFECWSFALWLESWFAKIKLIKQSSEEADTFRVGHRSFHDSLPHRISAVYPNKPCCLD